MLKLSEKWAPILLDQAETGMGYQICTVTLKDGRQFKQVAIAGGFVTKVRGYIEIPFQENEIASVIVTHDKWDFQRE